MSEAPKATRPVGACPVHKDTQSAPKATRSVGAQPALNHTVFAPKATRPAGANPRLIRRSDPLKDTTIQRVFCPDSVTWRR